MYSVGAAAGPGHADHLVMPSPGRGRPPTRRRNAVAVAESESESESVDPASGTPSQATERRIGAS